MAALPRRPVKLSCLCRRFWLLMSPCVLVACGGGDSSSSNPNGLAKYEGTWVESCAHPIQLTGGGFGTGSVRETLVFSKPDSSGNVTVQSTEDYFDTVLACHDEVTPALASVRNDIPANGRYARQELLAAEFGNAMYDVMSVNQASTPVTAVGNRISSVDIGGVPNWRISFSDGHSTDRVKTFAATSGEVGMLVSTGLANGQPLVELRFYGDTTNAYRTRNP